MTPDRYEVSSAGRQRLQGIIQKRGTKMGLPTWGGFLFGGVFVAVGLFIIVASAQPIRTNRSHVDVPPWLVPAAGASFALAGLAVWGMALNQLSANRYRAKAARQHPGEPALADYPWHPEGFAVSEWNLLAQYFAGAVGLTIFLSIFNWWAFGPHGFWFIKIIVCLFDLFGLAMWVRAAKQLLRALKFGHSRIAFASFPYRLTSPVAIRWQPSRGINQVNKGTFTLRCVEEWMETTGSGEDKMTTVVHEELWSAQWIVEQPRRFQLGEEMELKYDLPVDAQPTKLAADRPMFWELQVKLDFPGVGFDETYLVPVYGKA